jgi:peroxiredoxin
MKNKRFILRMVVLGIIFVALASAFYTAYVADASPIKIGEPAPDFRLQTLDGETIRLSDLQGQAVMLKFWFTWCQPCRLEMPHVQNQYQQLKDRGLEVLAINIAESQVAVSLYRNNLNINFPLLLDSNKTVTDRYGVGPTPVAFFIDPDGIVVERVEGMMGESALNRRLMAILPD